MLSQDMEFILDEPGFTEDEALRFLMGFPLDDPLVAHGSHNQQDHGNWARGISKKPFTPAQLAAHVNTVRAGLKQAQKMGLNSKLLYRDKFGVWDDVRDKQHREILDDVYKRAKNVPSEGKAILSGGPSGAGKTTTLAKLVNLDDYVIINPDDMKEELAKRGMIPEIPGFESLSPMERSTLVHEESRRLAAMLADRARRDGKNIIYDTTMTSYTGTRDQIKELDEAGYKKISAVFVDSSLDTSIARTRSRYAKQANEYRAGEGLGGRFLPTSAVIQQYSPQGPSYASGTFNSLRNAFDAFVEYDNSGMESKLVATSGDVT